MRCTIFALTVCSLLSLQNPGDDRKMKPMLPENSYISTISVTKDRLLIGGFATEAAVYNRIAGAGYLLGQTINAGKSSIDRVCLAPNGKLAAIIADQNIVINGIFSLGSAPNPSKKRGFIRDLESKEILTWLESKGPLTDCCFSHDGVFLFAVESGTFHTWKIGDKITHISGVSFSGVTKRRNLFVSPNGRNITPV